MTGTVLSADRVYRYALVREWLVGKGTVLFFLLNPSTADEGKNDPTIRRVMGFAKAWGFRKVLVGELFAIRSTDPKVLLTHADPVGPVNDQFLKDLAKEADLVVFAWGNWGKVRGRSESVRNLFDGTAVKCFGMTDQGEPRHPLYLARTAALVPFEGGKI
jgi:hypothetical protein